MNKNNIIISLFARLISYVLRYISLFFLAFLICEMLTIILMLTTNSGFEKIAVLLLTYTPFQNNFGKGTFILGIKEIISIFSFWSFLLFVITSIIDKIFHPKLSANSNLIFIIFSTIFHSGALIRQSSVQGLFPIITFFYVSSLVFWFLYKSIHKISTSLNSLFQTFVNKESINPTLKT